MPQPLPTWRADRFAALTGPDGWLNLTDRLEIAPGRSYTVGRDPSSDLPLSAGPDQLGTLTLDASGNAQLTDPRGQTRPFTLGPGGWPHLAAANLILDIHTSEGIPALRVRQTDAAPRDPGLRYFPDAPAWVIRAQWLPLDTPREAEIDMMGGARATVMLTHKAVFEHEGREVTLIPTHWKAGAPMFVFRDRTAGETYPAARFLIGEDVTDTAITLDFNKAHTPPCGFTPLAICPLPPPENVLPFRVEAGELAPKG
ncbi:MAG: DUF1684 domain-containing protein [Cereibacter sphaeroides]|uniref:DUF1684 domain-containing protein n=1 Tax=Cereibacter sphaeroides TaxID=1063 RepID=A0A2W5SEV1_CERSP|nr:MAG: DUF1684 domain-containing protein [Cereibacter sphaeroides]